MYGAEVYAVAEEAKKAIGKIGARSALLEAAMRVIIKHNLIDDLVEQMAVAKEENEKLSGGSEPAAPPPASQ